MSTPQGYEAVEHQHTVRQMGTPQNYVRQVAISGSKYETNHHSVLSGPQKFETDISHKYETNHHSVLSGPQKFETDIGHPIHDQDTRIIVEECGEPESHEDSIDFSNSSMKSEKKIYAQRFRSAWLEHEDLRDWLQPYPMEEKKAFCAFCKCQINAKISEIKKHGDTSKHHKNGETWRKKNRHKIQTSTKQEVSRVNRGSHSKKRKRTYSMEDSEIVKEENYSGLEESDEEIVYATPSVSRRQRLPKRPVTEFDVFGNYISTTLNNLPLPVALRLQDKLNSLVSTERMKCIEPDGSPMTTNAKNMLADLSSTGTQNIIISG